MNPQNSPTQTNKGSASDPGAMETGGTLSDAKTKIAQTARETASKVKGAANSTTTRAREEAARFAMEKKEATASRIGGYSSAMHDTAQSLEEKDPNIAWFTHRAADRLQGVAEYMRNRDFSDLRRDAEDMARRHPGAFFGGMFLLGLIAGNLVKASRRKLDEDEDYSGYETDWSRRESEHEMDRPELTQAERAAAGI